jgi:hypothetical protein
MAVVVMVVANADAHRANVHANDGGAGGGRQHGEGKH